MASRSFELCGGVGGPGWDSFLIWGFLADAFDVTTLGVFGVGVDACAPLHAIKRGRGNLCVQYTQIQCPSVSSSRTTPLGSDFPQKQQHFSFERCSSPLILLSGGEFRGPLEGVI